MGIYLPNIEMPKGCAFCKFKRRNGKKMVCPLLNEEWDIRDPMSADFKLKNCPLVHIPPHGRLIESKALLKVAHETDDFSLDELAHLAVLVAATPTIIPAEPA